MPSRDKLPSKGWGPWRKQFYSVYSTTRQIKADANYEHGIWHNVWLSRVDHLIYLACYPLWHWWHNRPNSYSRKNIERLFPKLRGSRNAKTLIVPIVCLVLIGLSGWIGGAHSKPSAQDQAYANLSALPLPARRDAFRAMTNEQRSSLWRTHLAKALNERELTGQQRAIIAQAVGLATPEFFAHHGSLDSLQIKDMFTGKDAREIFAQLGGPEPVARRNHVATDCSCSHSSDYCSTNCAGNGCVNSDYGCGTLWLFACDGLCRVAVFDSGQ